MSDSKPWVVYMLRCADGSLYTGITTDIARRCRQHNAGTASRYTRSRRPTLLAYQEPAASRSAALRREAALKRLSRRQKEALLRRAGVRPSHLLFVRQPDGAFVSRPVA